MTETRALANCQITVVGIGLMGGSLAGALRGHCRQVVGVDRDDSTVQSALGRGLIDRGTCDLAEGVGAADIVVLATPVRTILTHLDAIGPLLPQNCLLTDIGSTKSEIVAAMAQLPPDVMPLGGHPMCGKEISGISAADPTLFEGRTYILTPLERTPPAALTLGKEMARAAGAHPIVLTSNRQDFLAGTLSHLPYLLACALVSTADATTSADPAAWEIVAGGFRDTSRVASSEVAMMSDILLTNQDEILKALAAFRVQFDWLERLVEEGNGPQIRSVLSAIRAQRKEMFP